MKDIPPPNMFVINSEIDAEKFLEFIEKVDILSTDGISL